MAVKQENKRIVMKRSTVSGIIPTIPTSGATNIYDHTEGGFLPTDLYIGEFYANVCDSKLWFRSENGIHLIGYSGMTSNWVDLNDTPASFAGYAGYVPVVNSGATALEFTQIVDTDAFLNLNDTPSTFISYSGYSTVVNSGGTALEFTPINNTFIQLDDVNDSGYTSQYDLIRVNSSVDGLEMFVGTDSYVDLASVQTISGDKTFTGVTTIDYLTINNPLIFNGNLENTTINNISTDYSLSGTTDNELLTGLAIRNYVDTQVFGTGFTANYVGLSGDDDIYGIKTFEGDVIFNSGLTINDLSINNDLTVSGDTYNDIAAYQYIGDDSTDGSFRMGIDINGDLVVEKRISSVWIIRGTF